MGYRLLEHTADMGIEASADSLEGMFAAAALGLREIVFGDRAAEAADQGFTIEASGGDREELLVNWLNELLFLMQGHSFFPVDFHLRIKDGHQLQAEVRGPSDSLGLEPLREVKAVTFHGLAIEQRKGAWQSRVYVDL